MKLLDLVLRAAASRAHETHRRFCGAVPNLQEFSPSHAGCQSKAERLAVESLEVVGRRLEFVDQCIDPAAAQTEVPYLANDQRKPVVVAIPRRDARRDQVGPGSEYRVQMQQDLWSQFFAQGGLGRFIGLTKHASIRGHRIKFHKVAQCEPPIAERITPNGDCGEGCRPLAQRRHHGRLPCLELLTERDRLVAREQNGVADLAQEHVDRIAGAPARS